MEQLPFGCLSDGRAVTAWVLQNRTGGRAVVLDYGAAIQSLTVPDGRGGVTDVVLGYDTAAEYEAGDGHFGAVVGRVCNRIGGAAFTVDGTEYHLTANEGPNHLHGGPNGFDRYLWHAEPRGEALILSRTSPDGEEGYPGTLQVRVTYELLNGNVLRITYDAETDRTTPVNLTNHAYFNLNGGGSALGHVLWLNARTCTEVGPGLIPTGRRLPVTRTPLDFTVPKTVGRDLDAGFPQLRLAGGYDHNYILDGGDAACLLGLERGIVMTVQTTAPGLQLYAGNGITPRRGKGGVPMGPHDAVCLETQNFPDAVHHAGFPDPFLRPGQRYHTVTSYAFSTL